jgi:hypothetical protein
VIQQARPAFELRMADAAANAGGLPSLISKSGAAGALLDGARKGPSSGARAGTSIVALNSQGSGIADREPAASRHSMMVFGST